MSKSAGEFNEEKRNMEQFFGLIIIFIFTHAVLSLWTFRDARERESAVPLVWTGTVLLTGIVGFVGYLLLRSPK